MALPRRPSSRAGDAGFSEARDLLVERLRPRELKLSIARVELRLYRRTRTSADLVATPPHFVFSVRFEWTGSQRPRTSQTGSQPLQSPRSPRFSARSPRCSPAQTASSWKPLPGMKGDPTLGAFAGLETHPGFEDPWPWWDTLPSSYTLKRKWHDLVRFQEAIQQELAYDPVQRCRRIKVKMPVLPEKGDLDAWLHTYAATGDACALSRKLGEAQLIAQDRARCLDELGDLHWSYAQNRLAPYFADVNKALQEIPVEILAGSKALRRFATGGISGRPQPSRALVPSRFLGPLVPVASSREDLLAAVKIMRSRSAPAVGKGVEEHGKVHRQSTTAAAKLVLGS